MMTAPMPETMSPRDKVAEIVEAAIMRHSPSAVISDTLDDASAILAALASSGDHAELIGRLRKVESGQDDGFLPGAACTNWYRNPEGPAAADTIEALIAEVAALRASASVIEPELGDLEATNADLSARLPEAERKLAEAEGLLEDAASELEGEVEARYDGVKDHPAMTPKYDRDMDTVTRIRTLLSSKEAERG